MSDEIGELAARYVSGAAIAILSDEYGIDCDTVRRHLASLGVETRYRKLTADGVTSCASRYLAGETTVQIAADLGVHKDTVRRRLIGIGIQMRSTKFGDNG